MTAPWTALVLMREHRVGNWVDDAACAGEDPDLFFPKKGDQGREAKAVCNGCPVRAQCADYAATSPVMLVGVWGGTTEAERRHDGIEKEPRAGFRDRFLELRALGYNDLQIVNRLGMKPQSLLRQMQRHNIPAHNELVRDAYRRQQQAAL